MRLDARPRDRAPQPEAAILTGDIRIRLFERSEDSLCGVCVEPDTGVCDLDDNAPIGAAVLAMQESLRLREAIR